MGKYKVIIQPLAERHLSMHKRTGNMAAMRKTQTILRELEDHPYTGTGKPEALKHALTGFWSRRINQKDRMVYKVEEDVVTVYVVSAMGHYE